MIIVNLCGTRSKNQSGGVSGSASRTSWTGNPELADLQSIAGHIIYYMMVATWITSHVRSDRKATETDI